MPEDLRALARGVAQEFGLDPDLFVRQIDAESGFDPNAVSPVGARGLGQLMPETARGLGVSDPFDPGQNLRGSARFLRSLLDRYGGDYRLALAAYNAGPGNVDRYGGVPPFEETQRYVRTILGGGGPKVQLSVQAQGDQAGDQDIFGQVVAAKGQWTGTKVLDPQVSTTDEFGDAVRGPNYHPTYRYTFKDGTYLDAKKREDGSYEVTGGTALTSLAREQKAEEKAASAAPKTMTVGGKSYTWDAEQQRYVESPGVSQPAVADREVTANGKRYRWAPNYPGDAVGRYEEVPGIGTTGGAKPGRVFTVGRSIFRENDDGTVTRVETVPAEAPYRSPQQEEADRLALEKARRDLMPAQQQVIQNHFETVRQIQGMLERGELTPQQADGYVAASKAAAAAALRGTTPYKEEEDRRTAERERQRMGIDLLNQRTASGASLASSLISGAGHALLRSGQTSLGVDLGSVLNEIQSPDVAGYATNLLMGAQGGQVVPPGAAPNSPPGGFTVSPVGVSGMRGGLQPTPAGL